MKVRNVFFAVLMLLLVGCTSENKPVEATTEAVTVITESVTETTSVEPAQTVLNSMTLHEKIGQLFIVVPEALSGESNCVTYTDASVIKGIEKYPVGGIILFSKNIVNREQLTALLNDFQANSRTALFISVDEEGGSVTRVAQNNNFNVSHYESAADAANDGVVYDMSREIGTYLKQYGFNLDFAPVADVNTNPQNPVIGKRAFSEEPYKTAEMVCEAVRGFHDSGIMCCLKHFPGHGDTAEDSHYGCAITYKTLEQLKECELIPFKNPADMIMAGHIMTPNVTSDGLPASMSGEIIEGCLRDYVGFNGVVITDSMSMGAITDYFTADKAACTAIKAGADIVLMPQDLQLAYSGIEQGVANGEITEEEIDEHVLRIMRLKQKYGLIK